MAVLLFTLSEEGVSGLRDALICLNKFNEEVCLEARKDQVCAGDDITLFLQLARVEVWEFEEVGGREANAVNSVCPDCNKSDKIGIRTFLLCDEQVLFQISV